MKKLGASSWAAYNVSDKTFFGLALFASDADKDVKYVILVNARHAADGKAEIAMFELDKSGTRTTKITGATYDALAVDLATLQRPLRSAADSVQMDDRDALLGRPRDRRARRGDGGRRRPRRRVGGRARSGSSSLRARASSAASCRRSHLQRRGGRRLVSMAGISVAYDQVKKNLGACLK